MCASYVIIGDGIAGSSAAETLREADPDADVTVITEEGEALYNRILIKEFAKGKLPAAPVSIHDPDWYAERDIDLQLDTVVTGVDTEGHEVHTHEGDVYEYDKLVLATGGTPTASTTSGRSGTRVPSGSTRRRPTPVSSSAPACWASTWQPSVQPKRSTPTT